MKKFVVYKNDVGDLKAVKVGFSMPAFIITFLWLIYNKMYLHAIIYFPASIILGKLCTVAGVPGILLYTAIQGLIGYKGNEFLGKDFVRRGYTPMDSFEVEHRLDVEAKLEEMKSLDGV